MAARAITAPSQIVRVTQSSAFRLTAYQRQNRRPLGTGGLAKKTVLVRGRAADPKSPSEALRLMDACAFVVFQAGDFVLHMQLAAFEFRDRRIVDRGMRDGVSEFGFERLVLLFQFRKMRLDGHRGSLLGEIPDWNILTEASRQVDGGLIVRCIKSPGIRTILRHSPALMPSR